MNTAYILKNVRLETGFEYDGNEVVKTKTDLFCVSIENGKIKEITPNSPLIDAIDAKGYLMLPAFKDMHAHLDKMLFGLPWQAVSSKRKTVKDMIAYEQEMIPTWLETSIPRTEKMIDFMQNYGTSFVRSHVNIDPTSGLKSLENLIKAFNNKPTIDYELVAFPQHGLYYTNSLPLMKEAAQHQAIKYIGGVDPFSLDGNIEKPMEQIVQLAIDNNKGIDLHLHETGESGINTINYIINAALENNQLQGKSYISHAFALSQMDEKEVEELAEKLADAKVGIISSVPISKVVMPIPLLKKYGVEVLIGNDNIQDHWSTFGSGNMLQKVNVIAELYDYNTEYELSRLLGFATNDIFPLDDKGKQQWPKVGDKANFVLLDASCSAEAVSCK